jgi:hypothetical protein
MDRTQSRILGLALLIIGLLLALNFGGNRGFTAGILSGLAYIGGFVLAFIGAYIAFIMGRKKEQT